MGQSLRGGGGGGGGVIGFREEDIASWGSSATSRASE